MKTVVFGKNGKRRRARAALLALAVSALLGSVALADSAATRQPEGLRNEQQLRKQRQQEYTREHSDPSGKVRPDAYVKGIEHTRQMKVAPYIGARPLGEASPVPKGKKP